jgi:N,N'-diacetyllegionaminate synthase
MNLIAETAWHHDGDFEFFKQLVTSIAQNTNADYIKYHITLDVDEYIYKDHPGYEWVKKNIFTEAQWAEVINIGLQYNKKPMLLFNDTKAIDFGMQFSPDLVEIHSVCLNDVFLLQHLKSKLEITTKVVLGVGGTDIYEVENAIELIESSNIALMHGFQNYPTKYEDINFSKIRRIIQMYPQYQHGYADHTAWDNEHNALITLTGAALGVNYIEKHVTIATGKGRTDWQAAISIDSFNKITDLLKIVSAANGDGFLKMNAGEKAYSTFGMMKKAAIANIKLNKGDVLKYDDFSFKRTGQHSDLSQLEIINSIGKEIGNDIEAHNCINKKDIL